MENTGLFTAILFLCTTILTIVLFYLAAHKSKKALVILLAWLILQSLLSASGFFLSTRSVPPRTLLLALPALIFIGILFSTTKGKKFIDSLNPGLLCLLFVIRIPVEFVLYELYLKHLVPKEITFAGTNYDIFSGLTAPLIWYFGFIKKQLDRKWILVWNFVCLGLLLNVVVKALLSVPSPVQMLNFDQPNIAVLYFPWSLLPSLVVPLVLFAHLSLFRILFREHTIRSSAA